MTPKSLPALFTALALLSACAGGQGDVGLNKATGGTMVGAGMGGFLGSQIGGGSGKLAAVAIGTLLGGLLGHSVGSSLDQADQEHAVQAERQAYAAPLGDRITWNNPQTGHSGTVTPTRDGRAENGDYCREYRTTVTVEGQTREAYGTACRQPDGAWRVVG